MKKMMYGSPETANPVERVLSPVNRRLFLRSAGAAAVTGSALMAGCTLADHPALGNGTIDLGSGDIGILNYAYALEQLEAAFYTVVVDNFAKSDFSAREKTLLTDIRDHEIIHREFLKAALGSAAIPTLTLAQLNFSSVDFTKRMSVLATAAVLEDTGVKAYNGAGKLIASPAYLELAGKIVSVEGRHAAYIRYAINAVSSNFAGDDVVEPVTGLDGAVPPLMILEMIKPFLAAGVKISGNNLPK